VCVPMRSALSEKIVSVKVFGDSGNFVECALVLNMHEKTHELLAHRLEEAPYGKPLVLRAFGWDFEDDCKKCRHAYPISPLQSIE